MMARQTRDQLKRLNKLTEAQAAAGWGIILILGALLGTIYLTQASRTATVGRRVQFLQNELIDLERENTELERKIAEAQSLDRLQATAAALGFVPANTEDVQFLVIPDYPLSEPSDPLAIVPEAGPTPVQAQTMEEAIWFYLNGHISGFVQGEVRER